MNKQYSFDHKGMTEEELLYHSYLETKYPTHTIIETERYGLGKQIRRYGFYPSFLPILLHADHGPNQWDYVTPHMLSSTADYFGFYSKRLLDDWKKKSKKKAILLKSPFVFYKKFSGTKKLSNANGSIFFHAHSTFWTDKETDYELIFQEFQRLPNEFHPISICMHFVDVQKGRHKRYMEKGFPVYTAGNWNHPFFIENFYEIVKHFNYSFSNSIGSNTFYCLDIGIPFSLIKGEPKLVNDIDPNNLKHFTEHNQVKRCYDTIGYNINFSINHLQYSLIQEELGLNIGVSRLILSKFLYISYLKFQYKNFFGRIMSQFRKLLKFIVKPV